MSQPATPEHPERALVRQAIEQKLSDLPVTTNPLAISLNMRILEARDGWVRVGYQPAEGFTQGFHKLDVSRNHPALALHRLQHDRHSFWAN